MTDPTIGVGAAAARAPRLEPLDVLALASRLESTFDPGGNLPDDCEEWAGAHADVIAELRGLAECALMDTDEDYSPAARAPREPLEQQIEAYQRFVATVRVPATGVETIHRITLALAELAKELEALAAARSALPPPQGEVTFSSTTVPGDAQARASGAPEWMYALPRAPEPERTNAMDNIPEFTEPRFWVAPSLHGFGVFYRLDGRTLGVGCGQNVGQVMARNVAKALNDVVDDEVAALPRVPEPDLKPFEFLDRLVTLMQKFETSEASVEQWQSRMRVWGAGLSAVVKGLRAARAGAEAPSLEEP